MSEKPHVEVRVGFYEGQPIIGISVPCTHLGFSATAALDLAMHLTRAAHRALELEQAGTVVATHEFDPPTQQQEPL